MRLHDDGLRAGDKVAIELVNSPEYLEAFFAAQLLGCVPVNVNYRYVDQELAYLLDNSDAAAIVYHDEFAETVAARWRRARSTGRWPATEVAHGRRRQVSPPASAYEGVVAARAQAGPAPRLGTAMRPAATTSSSSTPAARPARRRP